MTDFDTILEQARLELHEQIDRSVKAKFERIEWWHIYRTTGMMIIRKSALTDALGFFPPLF